MNYVLGAVMGLVLGGIVGYLKNRFIWDGYLARDDRAPEDEGKALYSRMLISNVVNIITLVAAFFVREWLPFHADGIIFLIGTAVALAAMNRILSTGQKKNKD